MPKFMEIPIYTASEVGLTRATKALLAKKPVDFAYSSTDFDPPIKQDNKIVVKRAKKRKFNVDSFQAKRLFSIVRNMAVN